jgi:diguanylate cyclase (GGDEF)-like protein
MIALIEVFRGLGLMACLGLVLSAAAQQKFDGPTGAVNAQGVVTYCVDPDWPPFEQIDRQGQHVGIAAELLSLVAQRSGLQLQLLVTKDWDESLQASRDGRCSAMSFLNQTPKRDAWLVFTDPVLVDENVLIMREEHPFISDLASLSAATMVLPKGTSIEERVRRDYPNISLILVDTEAQAFGMVSSRKADMTMRSLIVAADTIKRQGWFNLKIAGQVAGYGNKLRIGVAKEQSKLRDALNVGVRSITPIERQLIVDRHIAINVTTAIDYTLAKPLLVLGLVILLTSAFWIRRLRKVNAQLQKLSHSDSLTGLRNRNGFDALFENELQRSRRQDQALSVVLLDVDFFKRVNDVFGHPTGDRVLQEVADLLIQEARKVDHVIRWGGEEFLLLCPGTSMDQAKSLAERMLRTTQEHDFRLGYPLTLSAGVATLGPKDVPGHMFEQVDAALYQAKNQGRNRVVLAQAAKEL